MQLKHADNKALPVRAAATKKIFKNFSAAGSKENMYAYSMLIPAMFFFGLFLVYPVFKAINISLYNYTGIGHMTDFIGIQNYIDSAGDKSFLVSISNTLKFVALNLIFTLSTAFIMAYILYKRVFGWQFYNIALFIPYITPVVVAALIWRFIYEPNMGMLNTVLGFLGLDNLKHVWLGEYNTAFGAVMVVWIWKQFPYYMLILYSSMMRIPDELLEAAKIDGANEWVVARKIFIPYLLPTISVCITFIVAIGFRAFDMIWILTEGGPGLTTKISTIYIFTQAFTLNKYGYANAIALEVFVIVGGIVYYSTSRLNKLFDIN